MSSFPGMRKLRITANDTKSLATKYSQAHFTYGDTEWFTAYPTSISGGGKLLTGGELISPASLKGQEEALSIDKAGTIAL